MVSLIKVLTASGETKSGDVVWFSSECTERDYNFKDFREYVEQYARIVLEPRVVGEIDTYWTEYILEDEDGFDD